MENTMTAPAPSTFADLLRSAVEDPGVISDAYRQFHDYSIGNQLLAWAQCVQRGRQVTVRERQALAHFHRRRTMIDPRNSDLGMHVVYLFKAYL